uniref:DCC1-like thiol-disulfide oxidoreductase family protein n=1 Tax=Cellvibrio fontiphilus TaxID=1815559 RepID=UPI002B4BBE72|nr:DCC1-like thiol-disulfide oxidoreductase family protein [Cellvibrio fontiphilus]
MNNTKQVVLVYDKQCPACNNYCQLVRIRADIGELVLWDAREPGPIMDEITALGWDIDQGMVLKLEQQLYYGADAIHMLSLLGSRSGMFNRLNFWLFKSKRSSQLLYPLLRSLRNLLLKLLGKTKINNLGLVNNDKF